MTVTVELCPPHSNPKAREQDAFVFQASECTTPLYSYVIVWPGLLEFKTENRPLSRNSTSQTEPVTPTPSVFCSAGLLQCSNPSNPVNSDDRSPSSVVDSSLFPSVDEISGVKVPVVFVKGRLIGGVEEVMKLEEEEKLGVLFDIQMVPSPEYCLPKKVALTLDNDSPSTSMDFHPTRNFILLVGTEIGRIKIYSVAGASCKEFLSVNFDVWHPEKRSAHFKEVIGNDIWISVNKVIWSSNGLMFGVAFAKHLVQLYSIFEAHDGSVNDMAFHVYGGKSLVITCGDDKAVKMWDASTGEMLNTLRRNAPVCSICTTVKENVLIRLVKEKSVLVRMLLINFH
ncbi:hypothetical protein K1719_022046 [Acacia pycnantha]|nr:hypothetical protein K1719_022046 [Acacia pycnantha]